MKSLLFALGLALCCFVQASQDQRFEEFDHSRKLGLWVNLAIACTSSDALEQIKGMSAFVADVSRPREGVISISALIPMPDGCKNVTYQFRRGEDGKYRYDHDDSEVIVESVKDLGNFVISTINVDNQLRATTLHSRTATDDPEILRRFKEECKTLGYSEDQIVVFDSTVKCK